MNRSKLRDLTTNKNLIFVTEDDPWQWVIAVEHAIILRKRQENAIIIYVAHSYTKEAKTLLKRILGWKGSRQNLKKSLNEYGIYCLVFKAFGLHLGFKPFSFSELKGIIYRGTVASTGKRNLHSIHDRWVWASNFQKAVRISSALVVFKSFSNQNQCFVPNGKIVSAAATVQSLRLFGYSVKILESGSKPDRLHLWNHSAQSQTEANTLLTSMWENSAGVNREMLSRNYFDGRRDGRIQDPYHLVSWTSLTTSKLLPELEKGKKVATFYSSSQIEQIGADVVPSGNFQDQGEALKSVLELLDSKDWIVYLRKHPVPRNAKSHFDDEDDIWSKVRGFSHLRIIEGNSKVDSFALAEKSEIVFHYNSSIGAEIIFYQLAPVVTTGITSWATLSAGYSALCHEELVKILSGQELQIERQERILPWAFFHSQLGVPFSLATLGKDNSWEIGGRNIHPSFKAYLQNRLIWGR